MPPAYLAAHKDRVIAVAAEFAAQVVGWTPERSLEVMDRDGVAMSVTSMSSPGIWFGDAGQTRHLVRDFNEYAARMVGDHKGRFASFAALPLPDVDASLKEIEYAADTLGCVGFGLMTNYGDRWPGDPAFAPVFDELNRRKAVVYFHPTSVACCANVLPEIPAAIVEYPFDTTRTIIDLLYGGTLSRCPDIKFIFSHGGGTLPMLAHRMSRYADNRPDIKKHHPQGALFELKRLYCDLVTSGNPISFAALRSLIGIKRMLFGSDFPYWAPKFMSLALADLGLDADDLRAIESSNARSLLDLRL
jgi:predicted TIM-barrel fold metal-dependent hydrolase